MKTPSPKLLLIALTSVLAIATTLTSPALAQHRGASHHQRLSPHHHYLFDYAPGPSAPQPYSNIPYYGNAPYDQRDDW